MSRFNTGNPLGSGDPRDLDDNAKNFDEAINTDDPNWVDRFGRFRIPVMEQERQFVASQAYRENEFDSAQAYRESRFNNFIVSSGYQFIGDYGPGIEFTEYNQLVRDANGEFWRLSGQIELPYTTTGAGIPEGDALVPAGDAVLRQDLSNPDNGAAMVGWRRTVPGAFARTVRDKLQDTVTVADFGVSHSSSAAEFSAQMNAAASHARDIGAKLIGVAGTFQSADTVFLDCDCDLSMMSLEVDGAAIGVGVVVGPRSGFSIQRDMRLPKIRNAARAEKTWGEGVGVEIANANTFKIYIPSVTDFGVGVDAGGYAQGTAYNDITLGFIYDNKINLRLQPKSETAWCNENTWHGGRLGHTPSKAPSLDPSDWVGTADIALELYDRATSVGGPNNNLFIRTSVESDRVEYMLRVCGSYNQFDQLRYEGSAKRVLLDSGLAGNCHSNLFIGGYQAEGLVFTEIREGSGVHSYNSLITGRTNRIHSSGPCMVMAAAGGTQPYIMGFPPGTGVLNRGVDDTDWAYKVNQVTSEFKNPSNAYPRIRIMHGNTRIEFGLGSSDPTWIIGISGNGLGPNVNWNPREDNSNSLGSSTRRWSQVYAGNGTINTSDEREKEQQRDLSGAERRVAQKLKGLLRAFKWKHAVAEKGDAARWHFGVMAQEVAAAFSAEGLGAAEYGLFCYDEWEEQPEILDEDGNVQQEFVSAGSRYGVRYDQLLAFIISAL